MKEGLKSVSVLFPLQWYTLDRPCLGNYKVVFERTESMSRHSITVTSRNVFFLPLSGSANVKSAFVLRGIHGRETSVWTNGKQGIHICLQLMKALQMLVDLNLFRDIVIFIYRGESLLRSWIWKDRSRNDKRFVLFNETLIFLFSLSPLHLFRPMKIAWRLRTGLNYGEEFRSGK